MIGIGSRNGRVHRARRPQSGAATWIAAAGVAIGAAGGARAQDESTVVIPPRPEMIEFEPLEFTPPDPADFRHELSNGVPVYLAPDHELPLINVVFTFRGGSYLDPADRVGLASATGELVRTGGAADLTPAELDEAFDFLAANASVNVSDTTARASLNSLASNFDESFDLFVSMLREPGFDPERVQLHKDRWIERMRQRNDDADDILRREWSALLYGRDHHRARQATKAMVDALSEADLRAMHDRLFDPANLHIAVTGDFEPEVMLAALEEALSGWSFGEPVGDPPPSEDVAAPGLYHVPKDIPQGKVYLGLRGLRRDSEDYIPALVMNEILGGGGFTSRIMNRVRTEEGLAYSAGSAFIPGVYDEGEFRAYFQSKNPTVALASEIILEEIERIRSESVTPEELEVAKNAFIESFPQTFESKEATLDVFVNDEVTDRPADFWDTFRERVRAVTAEDVRRVARTYLRPEDLRILVVGNWDAIAAGDLQGRATMTDLVPGDVTHLPRRDPLTLEPIDDAGAEPSGTSEASPR